jgi:hypothetical protein
MMPATLQVHFAIISSIAGLDSQGNRHILIVGYTAPQSQVKCNIVCTEQVVDSQFRAIPPI